MNLRPSKQEINVAKRKLQGFLTSELAQRTSKTTNTAFTNITQLQSPKIPNEILAAVFAYADAITLARVSCACKLFFNIVLNGKYWHVLVQKIMDQLNIFPAWRTLFNVNDTKKAIYVTLHANRKFLKDACNILSWFSSNPTATPDQEEDAKSVVEKLFRTKYNTNPWKVSTIGREKFEIDLTELKKSLPPSVRIEYPTNSTEQHPTLYIRIDTSTENHIYPRQTVRFYIPVSDLYPRERPFVFCDPPIYHPFINQATGVVSLEDIEKHSQYIQNQINANDSYVIRSLNSSLSASNTPVNSPTKLTNSNNNIVNNNNNLAYSSEKIEKLSYSTDSAEKSPNNNFDKNQQPIADYPIIATITTNNNNVTAPHTPVSSAPATPSSSPSSTSSNSSYSSPFCSPFRSDGQNVLKAVVEALQNLFVDTSYLTNYMNF